MGDRKKLRVAGVVGRDRGQIWVLRRLSCGGAEVEAREEARGQARGGVSMEPWETLGGGHHGGG